MVAAVMESHDIWPENTRVHTTVEEGTPIFEILQATAESSYPFGLQSDVPNVLFRVKAGDHAAELSKMCT
jgi:hypothetical protein